jgi:hypothetical protein
MLRMSSALLSAKLYVSNQLTIVENSNFTLTQYAGSDRDLKKVLGKLPARVGICQDDMMRISRTQIWSQGDPVDVPNCFITTLSSSRTRIEISGAPARDALSKCAAIDFHKNEFRTGQFVMTGMHHVPILIHCVGTETFHIYVMRTFALAIWDHMTDAALEFR